MEQSKQIVILLPELYFNPYLLIILMFEIGISQLDQLMLSQPFSSMSTQTLE